MAADALGCSRCGSVSQERLRQRAFALGGGGDDEAMCAVCLEKLEAGLLVVALPCAHVYHLDCITEWLKEKNTCPQCVQVI